MMFLHWPRVIYDVLLTLLPTVTFSLGANLVISREEVKITTSRLPVSAAHHNVPFFLTVIQASSHHQPVIPPLLAVTVCGLS